MKSVYLISRTRVCGPVNQALNILNGMKQNKVVDATLVTLYPEFKDNSWAKRFEDLGIKKHCLNASRFSFPLAVWRLRKFLKQENIDVVHSSGFGANVVSMFLPNKYTKISTQRCSPGDIGEKFPKFLRGILSKVYLSVIKRLDVNVACSNSLQRIFKDEYKMDIPCVQNGVNTDFFHPLNLDEKTNTRIKLGLDVNKKIYLLLGSLNQRKHNQTAINVFNRIKNEDIELLIVGGGPEMDYLKSISKSENIKFVGPSDNPLNYLQSSDILISCSLAEGLPNTVLEALSCGLPCILTDIGPHQELLKGSEAGVLFPIKDEHSLAIAVNDSLEWGNEKSINARNVALEKFGIRSLAKQYADIYKRATL